MKSFLDTVRERVVVYDGAMGTQIQERHPSLDDFWGKENCSEVLVLSRPDIIRDIHADFLKVGCDVVETNTFGGTRTVLSEFELADRVHREPALDQLPDFPGLPGAGRQMRRAGGGLARRRPRRRLRRSPSAGSRRPRSACATPSPPTSPRT